MKISPHPSVLFCLALVLLTACASGPATVSTSEMPTKQGEPPTETAVPTETQIPEPTPTPLPSLIIDALGHEMVLVSSSIFEMGSEAGTFNESPVHTVLLDGFYIDKYEVTNQQYAEFLNDQGNQEEGGVAWLGGGPSYSEENIHLIDNVWMVDTDYEDHPVIEVTWYGARAYCFWRNARLPTEAEWEKAAKGTEGYVYPWGNTWEETKSNSRLGDSYHKEAPVGSFPQGASPFGVLDMAGNVSEWVADWFDHNYYEVSEFVNPEGPDVGEFRTVRGGSSEELRFDLRTTSRSFLAPTDTTNSLGFRCASSLTQPPKLTATLQPEIQSSKTLPFADLGQIAFISDRDGNPEIYVMNSDGSAQARVTSNSATEFDPAWSPDGRIIAFSSTVDGNEDIYLINADGSGLVRLTNNPARDRNPAWSPDSSQIVFASQRDAIPDFEGPPQELYIMNIDGSQSTRLTNNTTSDYCPWWSPVNDLIAFSSFFFSYDTVRIDAIPATGSQSAQLIDTPGDDYCPRWSQDGSMIAFVVSYDDDTEDIFVANADGSDMTNLTDNPARYRGLAWSPDGNWVVFSSKAEGEWDIYVVGIDGSGLVNLTEESGLGGWAPSWGP